MLRDKVGKRLCNELDYKKAGSIRLRHLQNESAFSVYAVPYQRGV